MVEVRTNLVYFSEKTCPTLSPTYYVRNWNFFIISTPGFQKKCLRNYLFFFLKVRLSRVTVPLYFENYPYNKTNQTRLRVRVVAFACWHNQKQRARTIRKANCSKASSLASLRDELLLEISGRVIRNHSEH